MDAEDRKHNRQLKIATGETDNGDKLVLYYDADLERYYLAAKVGTPDIRETSCSNKKPLIDWAKNHYNCDLDFINY